MTPDDARRLAPSLPDAVEQDHHGRPSFRVGGRMFATLWTPTQLNVMAGEDLILSAVDRAPDVCSKVMWGGRLAAVRVELAKADPELVEEQGTKLRARCSPRTSRAALVA